jgi:hypothetical protein
VSHTYVFRCRVCHQVISSPYISLDRRTQQYSTALWKGKPRTTVNILTAQELFQYDGQACRALDEPMVVAELQLKTTHPSNESVVPCSRCATQVDRALPHVSYVYLEVEMNAQGEIAKVIDDTELAVLCRECEESDQPLAEAAADIHEHEERTRA